MKSTKAILTAVKVNEEATAVLVDLLTRVTEIKDIYCNFMDKITAKDEKDMSTADCLIRDALGDYETIFDDIAYRFSKAIGDSIQSGLIDVIYLDIQPNNA